MKMVESSTIDKGSIASQDDVITTMVQNRERAQVLVVEVAERLRELETLLQRKCPIIGMVPAGLVKILSSNIFGDYEQNFHHDHFLERTAKKIDSEFWTQAMAYPPLSALYTTKKTN